MSSDPNPIVVAPMAGGPSTPELVTGAAAAGALGFVDAGYRTSEQVADDIERVRSVTDHFGVNVFVPDSDPVDRGAVTAYRVILEAEAAEVGAELGPTRWEDDDQWDAKVDLLVSTPVEWVSFTFGVPSATVVGRLQRAGSRVAITVTTPVEASQASAVAPDALIVQSAAAGGHRGVFPNHRAPDETPLLDLVPLVREVSRLPLIAAGGVAGPDDVRALLAAGASAVQSGTLFLLAHEAGTKAAHRRALLDGQHIETVVTRSFTGRPARGLRNAFTDSYSDRAPLGYPAIHHLTAPIRARYTQRDDPEGLNLWAGTGFGRAREGTVGQIIEGLLE